VAAPASSEGGAGGGHVLAWIAAAASPVFAGTAAVVWFTGQAKHDAVEQRCKRDGCDAAEVQRRLTDEGVGAHETWTSVSLVAAGVALVGSVLLFVFETPDDRHDAPRASARRSEVSVHGRF
jgi:hypothetical protein